MSSLRGHHLICPHFFKGEGYDAVFVENLRRVIGRAKGEGITVQRGADEVCLACPHLAKGKCGYGEGSDEEIERLDALALRLLNLGLGEKAKWAALEKQLLWIFPEWKANACDKCDWLSTCRTTALWRHLHSP